MKINRNNYEAYLIDYLEGNLSRQDEETVQQFLAMNPDIAGEFSNLKLSETNIEAVKDSLNKSALYKSFNDITSITPENYEEFCIAYHEGDLDDSSKQRLLDYIKKHPEVRSLFELHANIRLQADPSVHFPGKRDLKKVQVIPARRIIYWISAGVAAAAAILLLWISLPNSQKIIPEKNNNLTHTNIPENLHSPEQIQEIHTVHETKITPGKVQNSIRPEYNQLAKVDTSDTRQLEKIVIAELKPREIRLNNEVPLHAPQNFAGRSGIVPPGPIPGEETTETIVAGNNDNTVLQRKILYSALNIGVKGFNTLTESQLALHTSQDDKGRLTGIAIDANNFGFIRRIQHNNQN